MTRDEIISVSKTDGGMFIVIPAVVKMDETLPMSAQMLYGSLKFENIMYTSNLPAIMELVSIGYGVSFDQAAIGQDPAFGVGLHFKQTLY